MKRAMRFAQRCLFLFAVAGVSFIAEAEELGESPSLQGFTGAINTPTAWTQREGTFSLLFTPQEDPRFRSALPTAIDYRVTRAMTFALGASPLRFVEAAARLSEAPGCCRDLSLNAKVQLPLQLLFPALPFAVAAGVQDFGGAVPHFRSNYVVASGRWNLVAGSVGYGTGPDRMKGWFGSAQIRPLRWLEFDGEYDGTDWNAGTRLQVPFEVGGAALNASFIAKTALTNNPGLVEWGAALGGDLAFATADDGEPIVVDERGPIIWPGRLTSIEAIRTALVTAGLESVRVAREGGVLAIEYENNVYLHSELDGLGVALGVMASSDVEGISDAVVVLSRRGLPLMEVDAPLRALRSYFGVAREQGSEHLPSVARIVTRPTRPSVLNGVESVNSSNWRLQATAHPAVRPLIGNEYSYFEGVFSVRPELQVGLWSGATAYARWDVPVGWTPAFADGAPLARYRGGPKLDFGLVQQAFPIVRGLSGAVGAGIFRHESAGALGELLWTPGDGVHALGVQAAWTQSITGERHPTATASWRYSIPSLDGQVVVRAGQFYEGDLGATLEASRFFGDVQVGAYYTRADFSVLGAFVSLPLMPWESMKPGLIQIRGPRRWSMSVQTTVHESNVNPLRAGIGVVAVAPVNLDATYMDVGRLSSGEVRTGFPKCRRAFERVQSTVLDQRAK